MYTTVPMETGFFLATVAAGVITAFLYDLLRISRRIIGPGDSVVGIQDLLFMIAAALILFYAAYRKNSGGMLYLDDMVVRTDSYFLEKNQDLFRLRDELLLTDIMSDASGSFDGKNISDDITIDYSKTNAQNIMNEKNISVEWISSNEVKLDFFVKEANSYNWIINNTKNVKVTGRIYYK